MIPASGSRTCVSLELVHSAKREVLLFSFSFFGLDLSNRSNSKPKSQIFNCPTEHYFLPK